MLYPIVVHKEEHSDYGIIVPDLAGCFSASDTLDDALNQAREAIECHLEGMVKDHEDIPQASDIATHQANADYADGVWMAVEVDISKLQSVTKRINISVRERVLDMIDAAAMQAGESRSEFITKAATQRIAQSLH